MPGKLLKKLFKKSGKTSSVVKNTKNVKIPKGQGNNAAFKNVVTEQHNVNPNLPKWLNEMVYKIRDKGTIRDMRWKHSNPEGYHYNIIRKNKPFSGTGSNQFGGEQVVNSKGMKVPGMYKDGGRKS
jgi:hypothetical protein